MAAVTPLNRIQKQLLFLVKSPIFPFLLSFPSMTHQFWSFSFCCAKGPPFTSLFLPNTKPVFFIWRFRGMNAVFFPWEARRETCISIYESRCVCVREVNSCGGSINSSFLPCPFLPCSMQFRILTSGAQKRKRGGKEHVFDWEWQVPKQ